MSWKELKTMDLKLLFIADYIRDVYSFSELCKHSNISRKTGYKWVARYKEQGIRGLYDKSRRPLDSPAKTLYAIRKEIIDIRLNSRSIVGPKKIQAKLKLHFPDTSPPSITTIYNILKKEGLIKDRKISPKVPLFDRKKGYPDQCNEMWSIDFKGQFLLQTGKWCFPLTVMDSSSRFLCGCRGLQSVATVPTKEAMINIFKKHGLPNRILSDNGVPFAAKTAGGLSRLAVWWIRLGITPERIKPGCPQQNGRHERMHRTLKDETAYPRASSMLAQQRRFNRFIREYNNDRPHESLNQTPPSSVYTRSERKYPSVLPELEYPCYFELHKVAHSGVIYALTGQVYISNILEGEIVGMEEIADGFWDVYFGPVRLGSFDERDEAGNMTSYWTLKR